MPFLLLLLCLFPVVAENDNPSADWGVSVNYYNEPAFKPGISVALDGEIPLNERWRLAVGFPSFTYFYFPYNYEAFYLYPEISFRRIGSGGFYFAVGSGAGLSLSRKVVPVYNLEGREITDPFTKQLVMFFQLYWGLDFSRTKWDVPCRAYLSLGWKGLYPNNLGFQHQPMMQVGVNYRAGYLGRGSGQ